MMKRKVCVVTGTRAEYGLLYWLMKGINSDVSLELQLIVTGMHLSPEYGCTYKIIENDGFHIDARVEMLLSSDTAVGMAKSTGMGLLGFADVLQQMQPDVLVVLGDRYEMLAAAEAGMMLGIPLAHIHGGEVTEGAIDDAIRHSITKMSLLHFTSTEAYRKRVIQLGESPERVFNVGAIGLDNVKKLPLLSREEFQQKTGVVLKRLNFLVTYHPVTLSSVSPIDELRQCLRALEYYREAGIIFTQPNADAGGREITSELKKYVACHEDRMKFFTTMGQVNYLSAIKHVDVVIGNSSSGICEVPAFEKPTVNIGIRQKGRIMAKSVINCGADTDSIMAAISKALSLEFRNSIIDQYCPYGEGNVSEKIIDILKTYPFDKGCLIKSFYDL